MLINEENERNGKDSGYEMGDIALINATKITDPKPQQEEQVTSKGCFCFCRNNKKQ